MVGSSKPHHIRSLKHPVKKIHVRVDCDNCYKWETLPMYEDEVEIREFKTKFFECKDCGMVFCSVCRPGDWHMLCPFCSKTRIIKLRPFDVYMCNICLQEWFDDRLCAVCRYDKGAENVWL